MLASSIWSICNTHDWLMAWLRHARLLVFPLLVFCLVNPANVILTLQGLVAGQTFVVICSWLLWLGVPHIISNPLYPKDWGIVINGHLEQPIMTSLMVVCLWTLKDEIFPYLNRKWIYLLCALSVGNVFFIMNGRTGFLAMVLAMTCALYFWCKQRFKFSVVWISIAPILLVITLGLFSPRFAQRALEVKHDLELYSQGNDATSQGYRIDYWVQSLKAIKDSPILGTGVGSWRQDYIAYGGNEPNPPSNPHQQFLLWFVESGLIGLLLMVTLFISFFKDAQSLSKRSRETMLSVTWIALMVSMFNCPFYGAGMGEFFLLILACMVVLGQPNISHQHESSERSNSRPLSWIEELGQQVITQPLSNAVPGNELNYRNSEGLRKLGWRHLRKLIYLKLNKQDGLMVVKANPSWKKGLWIYQRTAQIGDSLMDLAPRNLFKMNGLEVDLLTPKHLCEIFQDDPYFNKVFDRIENGELNEYDFVIIQSVHHRALKEKIKHFPRLPWICIQGFYDVPDFARSRLSAQRLIDVFEWTQEQKNLEQHAHQKLGIHKPSSNLDSQPNIEVMIAIGGMDPSRTYHQWDQVIRELSTLGINECVLIGKGDLAEQEAKKIQNELSHLLKIKNLINLTSLIDCAQMLERTRTLFTADGGMMHLGVASGTRKIVALFTQGINPSFRLPHPHVDGAIQVSSGEINDIAPNLIVDRFKKLRSLDASI
jgi:heptosyltransferase-2